MTKRLILAAAAIAALLIGADLAADYQTNLDQPFRDTAEGLDQP